jgi:choline dehydrogenase-like flavoprotein
MPTVPGGNTMLPSIMIGEKAADLIRGQSLPAADLPPRDEPAKKPARRKKAAA